jgi:alpha-L-rhamnosidase
MTARARGTTAWLVALLWLVAAPGRAGAQPLAPSGLMVDLLAHPERAPIASDRPAFAWVVEDPAPGAVQRAYQLRVASSRAVLAGDSADVWDSGRVGSAASVAVPYGGAPLRPEAGYVWTVRTWDARGRAGPWARAQAFRTGTNAGGAVTPRYPLVQDAVAPRRLEPLRGGGYFVDFGRAAFGTLQLTLHDAAAGDSLVVHLAEKLAAPDRVDRAPGGTVRYRRVAQPLLAGTRTYRLEIPPDQRNTGPQAIRMPAYVGEVMPFRYAEIERVAAPLAPDDVRQLAVHYPFDDAASDFVSSDSVLNAVWALSKYSIAATRSISA